MINFKISTPGRIVLSGEHSVMYGKHFVATSLDLRTKLEFCELLHSRDIRVEFPNVDLELNIPLEKVQRLLSVNKNVKLDPVATLKNVKSFITLNGMWKTNEQRSSLIIFFYLLSIIAKQENLNITPFHVRVFTEIPMSAGLGGSTSFVVCLTGCFLYWQCLQSGYLIELKNELLLKSITNFAKFCEEFLQDYECASVNTSVCIFGNIIKGQLINYTENLECKNITRMKILLIDSNIRQNKWTRAKKMSTLKAEVSRELEPILNKLDSAAIKMYNWLHLINKRIEDPNLIKYYRHNKSIKQLFKLIHQFLKKYNLSDETFNHICKTANNIGFTGFIGFGARYVYILIPPSIKNAKIEEMSMELRNQNFDVINTSINCEGIKLDE